MNHVVIQQELDVEMELAEVDVEGLFLESFGQGVDFLANEEFVLDELFADGLRDNVPPPQDVRQ